MESQNRYSGNLLQRQAHMQQGLHDFLQRRWAEAIHRDRNLLVGYSPLIANASNHVYVFELRQARYYYPWRS